MVSSLLVIYASLALGVSFLCSMLESVLLSISHSHIQLMQNDGKKAGKIWSRLKENDSVRPLTAILTLNTIAHTVGAVGVGSVVHDEYGNEWVTLASAILTVAVLLLSEILPKTIGSAYWKKLATPTAHVTQQLTLHPSSRFTYVPLFSVRFQITMESIGTALPKFNSQNGFC